MKFNLKGLNLNMLLLVAILVGVVVVFMRQNNKCVMDEDVEGFGWGGSRPSYNTYTPPSYSHPSYSPSSYRPPSNKRPPSYRPPSYRFPSYRPPSYFDMRRWGRNIFTPPANSSSNTPEYVSLEGRVDGLRVESVEKVGLDIPEYYKICNRDNQCKGVLLEGNHVSYLYEQLGKPIRWKHDPIAYSHFKEDWLNSRRELQNAPRENTR